MSKFRNDTINVQNLKKKLLTKTNLCCQQLDADPLLLQSNSENAVQSCIQTSMLKNTFYDT